ncbi:MAG: ABC transporter permease [Nitrospirae bacterium]|nr:ABC transporter permease [Nitrospirota bacterium]
MQTPTDIFTERLRMFVHEVQEFSLLSWAATTGIFKRPRYLREVVYQMDVIGVGSVPIVLLTGVFTGMVLALQTSVQLQVFGASMYVGKVVAASMVRELGPVLAALMVAGRVGSGIAAELGSMVDTEQIDAMKVEGSDPIKKLVVPRVLACVLMLPLLTVIADAVGLFGGQLIAVYQLRIDSAFYWSSAFDILDYKDVIPGLVKPAFFGFIIAMVGSHQGLTTHGGTVGVGRSTTESVVYSSISILASDFFITKFFLYIL